MNVHDITIYTMQGAVLERTVVATMQDFESALCSAFEEGSVILDTIDGTKIIINPMTAVAVEVSKAYKCDTEQPKQI